MEILELKAQVRQTTGKSKARQMRANGLLPANLYGHQTDSIPLTVDGRQFHNLVHSSAGTHVILKLMLDTDKAPTVIVKEVQRNPVKDEIIHVDFQSVALDEKITAAVPLSMVGDSVGVREGGILQHGLWELQVEALPTDLPDHIEVDISDLKIGDSLHASEINLPPELTMVTATEDVVATVLPPVVYKEEVPEVAVEEEVPEAAEGAAAEEKEEGPSEGSEGS